MTIAVPRPKPDSFEIQPLKVIPRGGQMVVDMDPDVLFSLNAQQKAAFKAAISGSYDEIFYGGAMRSGKTALLAYLAFYFAITNPGKKIMLVAGTISDCQEKPFRELLKIIPPEFLAREPRMEPTPKIILPNAAEIVGQHGQDPERFKGFNDVVFVGVDEANQCNPLIFPMIFTRFSKPVGSDLKHLLFLTGNPTGGFIYDRFVRDPDNSLESTLFIKASARDNGYIDQDAYLTKLKNHLTDDDYRTNVEGDWSAMLGHLYPQFKPTPGDWGSHVCAPFSEKDALDPGAVYTHVQGMDYATRNVTCIVFLAKNEATGHVYAYDEVWGRGMSLVDVAKRYKEKCDKHNLARHERFVCADWNMWEDREGFAPANALQFDAPGHVLGRDFAMPLVKADKRSQRYSTVGMLLDYKKLSILTTCPNLSTSLQVAEFKADSPTDQRFNMKAESVSPKGKDALDALGYGMNKVYPPDAPIQQVSWDRDRQAPPLDKGAFGSELIKRAWRDKLRQEQENTGEFSEEIQFVEGTW